MDKLNQFMENNVINLINTLYLSKIFTIVLIFYNNFSLIRNINEDTKEYVNLVIFCDEILDHISKISLAIYRQK